MRDAGFPLVYICAKSAKGKHKKRKIISRCVKLTPQRYIQISCQQKKYAKKAYFIVVFTRSEKYMCQNDASKDQVRQLPVQFEVLILLQVQLVADLLAVLSDGVEHTRIQHLAGEVPSVEVTS